MRPHPRGRAWEALAEQHLVRHGLSLVTRNFHCRLGEIDLVMDDRGDTVFVEVRYRRSSTYGGAVGSITRQKQLRIARAAGIFLNQHRRRASSICRFDIVAISGNEQAPQIEWLREAFESPLGI